jgi:tRNA-dihydrouridine synthase
MLRETGCAALMIGRGAVGNPFVFREIASAIDGRGFTPPTLAESLAVGLRQLRYAIEDKGEETAVLETRKSFASYLVGFRGAAALRARIHEAKTYAELEALAREILSASEL